jgi:hypothetical protein
MPEREEDERETGDEEQCVDERQRRARCHVVERHPRDEGDVARDEREHTGREEARQPGAEGDRSAMSSQHGLRRGGGKMGDPREGAASLLEWYFALKYRVFRRERRPDDGRRGLVMLQIDALAYAELRRAIELGYCPTIEHMVREEGLHPAPLVLRAALGDAVCPGGNLLRRERGNPRFPLLR